MCSASRLAGYVAQQLVLDAPELVRRLVLSGTGSSLGPSLQRPLASIQSDIFADPPSVDGAVAAFFPVVASTQGKDWAGRAFSSRAGVAGRHGEPEIAMFTGYPQLSNLILAYLSWDADPKPSSMLTTIQKDVLVTVGSDDQIIPPSNGYILARQIPRASLIQYPTSGHGHLFQYPEIAARQIGEFLDGNFAISPFSAGAVQDGTKVGL